jgi:uncharacterized protein YndB with AHSA1/START domain
MNEKLQHTTIILESSYRAPVERVFSEFADPVARARWSPTSNDVLIYDQTDVRVGGRDLFRCGPKDDPKFRGETLYPGESTSLKLTVQMVSLVGAGMIEAHESGNKSALEKLARHLSGKL